MRFPPGGEVVDAVVARLISGHGRREREER